MINESVIKKEFGLTISRLRQYKGLTQEKLAEYIHIQANSLAQIESGRNFVSAETLSKLCEYFGVAPAFFFMKNPQIMYDENKDFVKEIISILPTLSKERLKDLYEIMLLFQKES